MVNERPRRRLLDPKASLEVLEAENERLREAQRGADRAQMFVVATVISALVAVIAIMLLAIFRPDNTSTGTVIIGLMLPIITAFLAASIRNLTTAVNGRLTQLLDLTQKSSMAEGILQERDARAATEKDNPQPVTVVNTPLAVTHERTNR